MQSTSGCCVHPVIASNRATNVREATLGNQHMSRRLCGASSNRFERMSGAIVELSFRNDRRIERWLSKYHLRASSVLGILSGEFRLYLALATHKSTRRRMGVERADMTLDTRVGDAPKGAGLLL